MTEIRLSLSKEEQEVCLWVAQKRYENARKRSRSHAHGWNNSDDPIKSDYEGAQAECVSAKLMDRYWNPVIDTENLKSIEYDVSGFQVRSTTHPTGRLIVHDSDPDSQPFLFVKIEGDGIFLFPGWMYGRDAKKKEFWWDQCRSPAYFVPPGSEGWRQTEELYEMLLRSDLKNFERSRID